MHFICHCIYHSSERTFVLVYVELPTNNLDKKYEGKQYLNYFRNLISYYCFFQLQAQNNMR